MGLFDRWRASTHSLLDDLDPSTVPHSGVVDVHDADAPDLDESVRLHVARLTAAAEEDPQELDVAAFQAALTSRLVAQGDLPYDPRYHYISSFAPHIAEVLTLDLPTAVVTLPVDRLQVGHHSLPATISAGRRNLQELMKRTEVEVRSLGHRQGSCTAIVSDSPYTGSFARFLAEAVAHFLPAADTSNGIVFAVPDRHAIVLQTCAGAQETRSALEAVPAHARAFYDAGVGPVSPHVYHWYHRELTCLTTDDGNGGLVLETTPLLDNILGRGGRQAG